MIQTPEMLHRANLAEAWRNMIGQSHYEWLCGWYADPANADRVAEIERSYIATMQRDRQLD